MTTITVPIDSITIGERRREEMGDIAGLAASIQRYGMLHPVVIDDARNLIGGGRRIAALRLLGRAEVEARLFGTLTEAERREIELEENLRRKDLTPAEITKTWKQRAEAAATVLREQAISSEAPSDKTGRGRPAKPDSREAVASYLGTTPRTLYTVDQHDAAMERYPELREATVTQDAAIKIGKHLDALPEPEREAKREAFRRHDPATIAELRGLDDGQRQADAALVEDVARRVAPAEVSARERATARRVTLDKREQMRSGFLRLDPDAVRGWLEPADLLGMDQAVSEMEAWARRWRAGQRSALRVIGGAE